MDKPLLCVVITGPSIREARAQINRAAKSADLVEFRLDLFEFSHIEAISNLMAASSVPVMLTLRHRSHGGEYSGDDVMRSQRIRALAALCPAYLDLEHNISTQVFEDVARISPGTQVVCSYHNFETTPKDLECILDLMTVKKAAIYKVATMANTINDSMRMIHFLHEHRHHSLRIAGVCLGKKGECSRLLGPIFGSAIIFAALSEELKAAPGQLAVDFLLDCYRFRELDPQTAIYGLIGDPVSHSQGHLLHNAFYKKEKLNAIYIRFPVAEDEAAEFISYAKKLGFQGLSVTMPLKEWIVDKLDESSEAVKTMGACNTLIIDGKKLIGSNTDGAGALEALQQHTEVSGKKAVVLGAGGTARAIASELRNHGAEVTLVNRTLHKAQDVADHLGCLAFSLEQMAEVAANGYDILINCTPIGMFTEKEALPFPVDYLLPGTIVMDVAYSQRETLLLREAIKKGCQIVCGQEMFEAQARGQQGLWFQTLCC